MSEFDKKIGPFPIGEIRIRTTLRISPLRTTLTLDGRLMTNEEKVDALAEDRTEDRMAPVVSHICLLWFVVVHRELTVAT